MKKSISLLIICSTIALVRPVTAQESFVDSLYASAVVEMKLMIPMRDGVRLATDIYRPNTDEPVPIIFSRTPYNFNWYRDGELNERGLRSAWEAVKRGYAYVVQNERGRFFSEGEWDILGPPLTDGYDALTWMEEQSWSNGKVGTLGCSSTAEWQMGLASMDHPAHAAMVPMGYGAGVGRVAPFFEQGNWYRGGAQQMLFTVWLYGTQNSQRPRFERDLHREDIIRLSKYFDLAPSLPSVDWSEALWHLPVTDIINNVDGPEGIYEKMIVRKPNDPAWYEGGLYHDNMPFGVPSLWMVSWYDVSTGPNLALYNHVQKIADDPEVAQNQYMVIAPTTHCGYTRTGNPTIVGERNLGDARFDYNGLIYAWFDYWLKGEQNGVTTSTPKVQYYTMGKNAWQTSTSWPPAGVEMKTYYLDSDGNANSLSGDGRLTTLRPADDVNFDAFTYDPSYPVPSYGGNVCCTGNAIRGGAFDQREIEALREDILIYTTEPLETGLEISGTIEITLYISSDAKDTDFTVKLLDVYPDGSAYNLDETIQRARYREGYEKEVFMDEGVVYTLAVSPMSTSNYFAPEHRIRIEVSSSNFPRFTRNLNTGGNNFDETVGVVAHNTVHHSNRYPSQIRFPVFNR